MLTYTLHSAARRLLRRRLDPRDLPGRDRHGGRPNRGLQPARHPTIRLAPREMLSRRLPRGPRQAAAHLGLNHPGIRRVPHPDIPPARREMLFRQPPLRRL